MKLELKLKTEKEYLNGSYKKIADLIGINNARSIFEEYHGQQITFPVDFYNKQYVYDQIINEFDGTNSKELAQKYGYSERTVRRILTGNTDKK